MRHYLVSAFAFAGFLCTAPILSAAGAECVGPNLFYDLPAEEQAALRSAAESHPFATGNFWIAEKGERRMVIVGTYHMDDPRHAQSMAALGPEFERMSKLLVEAGPEEEKALVARLAREPELMFITEGPSLIDQLPAPTWEKLSTAMNRRGVPSFMAAKFQPWYASLMLAIAPCQMVAGEQPKGLDGQLIETAEARGLPVEALEPYDMLFGLFDEFQDEDMVRMIDTTLAMDDWGEAMAVTLADLYFTGDARLMWELSRVYSYDLPGYSRAEIDAEFDRLEKVLMVNRNRAWIPVIEQAAEGGDLMVAFGALHLAGEEGVLNLLADAGWMLREMDYSLEETPE